MDSLLRFPLLLLVATQLSAGLVAWNSLASLAQRADLIVVGQSGAGTANGPDLEFRLQVTRVLKGDAALSSTSLQVRWQDGVSHGPASPTDSRLWFLSRANSAWQFRPVMQGAISFLNASLPLPPGSLPDPYRYPEAAPVTDKVASEIAAGVEFQSLPPIFDLSLFDELNSPVILKMYQRLAAHALASIHTRDCLPYLAALLDAADAALRAEASGGFASFANGLPVQTPAGVPSLAALQMPAAAPYKNAETVARFALAQAALNNVAYWRGWWSTHRAELAP